MNFLCFCNIYNLILVFIIAIYWYQNIYSTCLEFFEYSHIYIWHRSRLFLFFSDYVSLHVNIGKIIYLRIRFNQYRPFIFDGFLLSSGQIGLIFRWSWPYLFWLQCNQRKEEILLLCQFIIGDGVVSCAK